MTRVRTYSELSRYETFDNRYAYLRMAGEVGASTFGFDRWLNQRFYRSREWHQVRDHVIVRDKGCDLGVVGHEIRSQLMVHHMNPMQSEDLVNGEEWILDPEYLITTTHRTHNAIHYGDDTLLVKPPVERRPGDTKLW